MTKDEQYLASGAYALDALTADEVRAFERALSDSPDLAVEADELRATAALLALAATPVEPSAGLKASIMAKLSETPQDAPQGRHGGGSPALLAPDAAEGGVGDPSVADTDPAPVVLLQQPQSAASFGTASATTPATTKAQSRWFARPVVALVAAAAAVALFVGGGVLGTSLNQNAPSTSQQAAASSLAEIYAASDVQSSHSTVDGGGEATVLWSAKLGRSAVVATGLPSLASNKTYEAWYINGTTVTPAGTFTPGGDTTAWHVLSGTLTAGATVGVTVEPAGGSQAPTTTPILAVQSV